MLNTISSVRGVLRMMLTYAAPIFCSTRTGETRITATMVPITSEPMAEKNVRYTVMPKAATMSYLLRRSPMRRPFGVGEKPGYAAPLAQRRGIPRGVVHEQGSAVGGLTAVSTLKSAGPRLASTAFCHEPSSTIFFRAALIFSQVALSPFLMPMP